VADNDSDSDGDSLQFRVTRQANFGIVSLNQSTGLSTYTPLGGTPPNAEDSFEYMVEDGLGRADSATVLIRINLPPVISIPTDQRPCVMRNASAHIIDLGQFVSDAETPVNSPTPNRLSYSITIAPALRNATNPSRGSSITVAANDDGSGRLQSYRPRRNSLTDDRFTFRVADPMGRFATAVMNVRVETSCAAPPAGGAGATEPIFALTGYITGATAFFDSNGNRVADFLDRNGDGSQESGEPAEPTAVTAANGGFTLSVPLDFDLNSNGAIDPTEGHLVVTGGTITAVLMPQAVALLAPAGSLVVTPLTTLVTVLIEEHGMSLPAATECVRQAFGLPNVDFTQLDYVTATESSRPDAPAIAAAGVRVINTIAGIASLVHGVSGEPTDNLGNAAFAALAQQLAEDATPIDLADVNSVAALIASTAARAGIALDAGLLDAAASTLAAVGARIGTITATSGADFLTELYRIEAVGQGPLSRSLAEAGAGALSLDALRAVNTGQALDDAVSSIELGNIVPPELSIDDVARFEGDTGTTEFVFTVRLSAPSAVPVEVRYATADGSATSFDNDYEPRDGVLVFDTGTTEQTITVLARGDRTHELSQSFFIRVVGTPWAVLADAEGEGAIVNDDSNGGNVVARLRGRGRTLVLTGDSRDNGISIEQIATRSYRVTVLGGTTLDGQLNSRVFTGIKDIHIATGDGDDAVVLDGSAHPIDIVGSLRIDTGAGDDSVRLDATSVRRRARIQSESGNDRIAIVDSLLADGSLLFSGSGRDTMELRRSRSWP
jgi:hypothetical protein